MFRTLLCLPFLILFPALSFADAPKLYTDGRFYDILNDSEELNKIDVNHLTDEGKKSFERLDRTLNDYKTARTAWTYTGGQ